MTNLQRHLSALPKWLFAALTPILLWASWPAAGFAPLLFVALTPLLILEDRISKEKNSGEKSRLFPYAYLSFVLFNALTTWWVWYASAFGVFGAVLANSLLMCIPFHLFHHTRRVAGNGIGYTSLVIYWTAFEHLHMDWDLSWPWLNLGNGFAAWADMVQWYEYTGTQGGTIWIWTINILLLGALTRPAVRKQFLLSIAILIIVPLMISWRLKNIPLSGPERAEVVVVQPNVDPYNEKFSGNSDDQLDRMLRQAASMTGPNTDLVVLPETALPDGIWENEMSDHPQILRIRDFIRQHPQVDILTGLMYYKLIPPGDSISETARPYPGMPDAHYDVFNSALFFRPENRNAFHHKSKLVPGVEKMPYPSLFGYLESFAIDLGGITGSLGTQKEPSVFNYGKITAAPVICYESIYGEYVGEYIRKGANLICIMTNDGWWSDTPGYRQHCQYARLRAIEHRRGIARSANTGISCFINTRGEIQQPTRWWVPAVIRQDVELNSYRTFYTIHGDFIGRLFSYIGFVLAFFTLIKARLNFRNPLWAKGQAI